MTKKTKRPSQERIENQRQLEPVVRFDSVPQPPPFSPPRPPHPVGSNKNSMGLGQTHTSRGTRPDIRVTVEEPGQAALESLASSESPQKPMALGDTHPEPKPLSEESGDKRTAFGRPVRLGGIPRAEVVARLESFGLALTAKSSDHFHRPGDPLGVRVVVPRRDPVVTVYGYKMEDEGLPGFVPAADRKAKRLGQVSVVCELTDISQVETLGKAVLK